MMTKTPTTTDPKNRPGKARTRQMPVADAAWPVWRMAGMNR